MLRMIRNTSFLALVCVLMTTAVQAEHRWLQCLDPVVGCFEMDCHCGEEEAYMMNDACTIHGAWCTIGYYGACPPQQYLDDMGYVCNAVDNMFRVSAPAECQTRGCTIPE